MNRTLIGLSLLALASPSIAAPIIDLGVSVGRWNAEPEGTVGSTETDIDVLGLDEESGNVLTAVFEHPVPVIPNIRVKRTALDLSGTGTLTEDFTFDDVTFPAGQTLNTDIDLTHTDFTFYYGLPELIVDIDLGATVRVFDGKAEASSVTAALQEEADLDFGIPMLFASVRIDLPLTGLFVGAEGNAISYDDNELTDFTAKVGYSTDIIPFLADLEIEAGYRSMDLKIDDDDLEADIKIDGPFANLTLAF